MDWCQLASAQGGVITHAQLIQAGLSTGTVSRMASRGHLRRLDRGVYLSGGAPWTYSASLWRAHLATNGVLMGATAGRLWGVYDGDDRPVEVVVPPGRRIQVPAGVTVFRRQLPPHAVRSRSDLPVTGRAWTVVDLLGSLDRSAAFRLADRALQRRWITPQDCERRLRNFPGWRGNGQLRQLVLRLGDGAAADSERLLHRLLRTAGMTGWLANHEVWAAGELVGVIDVAIPARRLAIEVDGMAYHVDVDRFRRDRARQNALVALGWTVLRFTWADLTERPGYVIAAIRRLAA